MTQLQLPDARFNGPEYIPDRDHARLRGQALRVFNLMRDGEWRSLSEISRKTGDPESSVSAQLRHFRKERFGGHTVHRKWKGYFIYKLEVNHEHTNH